MPRLILEARRVAATVIHGLHGRRRAGPGENFWQFRRFVSGEPAQRVDWRRSARDDHLYVREREWEAAHTVWIWPDRSPSMAFASRSAQRQQARPRARRRLRARRSAGRGGERVGIAGPDAADREPQRHRPHGRGDRCTIRPSAPSLPPAFAPSPLSEIVRAVRSAGARSPRSQRRIAQLSATGAHGHLVQIVDPAEETFPYSGRIEFVEPEGAGSITAGRAENLARRLSRRLIARHRDEIRAETDRLRLELHHPPHRPPGDRTAARAARPHRRGNAAPRNRRPHGRSAGGAA